MYLLMGSWLDGLVPYKDLKFLPLSQYMHLNIYCCLTRRRRIQVDESRTMTSKIGQE